ncbi:ICOS ligand-like isoform X2 [Larimichthys crocea]|uniref:ICOS ligand-like isoform X2 n=1 Tax=Larimichthys crocea TaxID=215358 RepID=UPI000F603F86|nr:ICOS ligand-like isoform X2 [Larimichthys crocea]XP_027146972.1 ICOS ligand-like isoform X2 [Larimichthys crocea]XP_027146973.1 ICOS ligand-like isoform X2 [Larimichthys crocea]
MISTDVLILLLCASITGQTPQRLNATLGHSVLIPCSLPVPPRWFYWQEDQSSNILFHWDPKGQTLPGADEYMNRCQVFKSEFSSGNISIRLDNVAVEDDLKTFWVYVSFYDEQKKLIKPPEQRCKSTLQVSSPYKDHLLTINNNNNSATCTAHGGYPEPKVSWTGLKKSNAAQLDLQDAETSLQRDPTEKTFSVTSCVSVKELQSVTCIITNPHSHEIIKRTAKIDDPGEDQQWFTWIVIFFAIFCIVILFTISLLILYSHRTDKKPPNGNENLSEDTNTKAEERDGAADNTTDQDDAVAATAEQEAKLLTGSKKNTSENDKD